MHFIGLLARALGWLFIATALLLATAWMSAVLYSDGPLGSLNLLLAVLAAAAAIAVLTLVRPWALTFPVFLALCFAVAAWWFSITPGQGRSWQPDVAQTPWAESTGETITVHHVRQCDYRSASDFTARWETRTVRLSDITGLELFLAHRGPALFAQPIVSFQFSSGPPLCVSLEPRCENGETFTRLAGLFRRYEMICVIADERDLVARHASPDSGEQVYLYRMQTPPERARALFVDYLRLANDLNKEPAWYHTLAVHITESLRLHRLAFASDRPWDWRLPFTGKLAECAYDRGLLPTTLPFTDLTRLSRVNGHARVAAGDPEFSHRLREALPDSPASSE